MPDLYTLGAASVVDANGNLTPPICHTTLDSDVGDDESKAIREDMGDAPLMFAPCITYLPAPPDDDGSAEGVCIEGVGGFPAVCVGGRDIRVKDVAGQLAPKGEACFHSTGTDATKRSKVFCKEDLLSLLVGNDNLFLIDRANKLAILNVKEGGQVELSKTNGFLAADSSGAAIQVKAGEILLNAGKISMPGGANIGGDGALPIVLSTGLISYLEALDTLLAAIVADLSTRTMGSPTPGPAASALTAFEAAATPLKVAMVAKVTNGK